MADGGGREEAFARLASAWADPSFRRAMSALVSLDVDQLSRLGKVLQAGFSDEREVVARVEIGQSQSHGIGLLVAGVTYLQTVRAEEDLSADQLLAWLREVSATATEDTAVAGMSVHIEQKREALIHLLEQEPKPEGMFRRARVQHSVLPTLEAMELSLDYRVDTPMDNPDAAGLVPVIIARASFDEPVSSGRSTVFQIPDEVLRGILEEVERVRRVEERVSDALPRELIQ